MRRPLLLRFAELFVPALDDVHLKRDNVSEGSILILAGKTTSAHQRFLSSRSRRGDDGNSLSRAKPIRESK